LFCDQFDLQLGIARAGHFKELIGTMTDASKSGKINKFDQQCRPKHKTGTHVFLVGRVGVSSAYKERVGLAPLVALASL
jgi:hypothetical protein